MNRRLKTVLLAIAAAVIASIALAHSDGIYNPTANNVGNFEGIDSNAASSGSTLACTYTPVTSGTQNVAYTGATPSASGGVPAYTFSETGALPTGLSINTSTGVISGTPSVSGTFTGIQVQVADTVPTTVNCGASFTLVVAPEPFGLSFVTKQQQLTPGTNQCDFGTISIGAADSTRQIIVAASWRTTASATISSVTVGGSSAAQISGANAAVTNGTGSTIWIITVPAGTTADIVANFSAAIIRCEAAVYRLVGTTAASNGGNATTAASGTVYSSSGLSVTAGGGAVGTAIAVSGPSGVSGTNLTIDVNEALSSNFFGAGNNTTASGATTFTFTFNSSSGGSAAWATFSP